MRSQRRQGGAQEHGGNPVDLQTVSADAAASDRSEWRRQWRLGRDEFGRSSHNGDQEQRQDVPAARPAAVLVPTLTRLTLDKLINTAVAIRAKKERPLVDGVHEDALDGSPGLKLHLNVATRTVWLLDLRPIPLRGRQITV